MAGESDGAVAAALAAVADDLAQRGDPLALGRLELRDELARRLRRRVGALTMVIPEDAVRLRSLAAYPRRHYWDCYPGTVRHRKAEAILRFLLARGLPFEDGGVRNGHLRSGRGGGSGNGRTLWLMDRWDQRWQRFCKRPGRTQSPVAGHR